MEAVEDKVGGNNCALAQKIAAEHPGESLTTDCAANFGYTYAASCDSSSPVLRSYNNFGVS